MSRDLLRAFSQLRVCSTSTRRPGLFIFLRVLGLVTSNPRMLIGINILIYCRNCPGNARNAERIPMHREGRAGRTRRERRQGLIHRRSKFGISLFYPNRFGPVGLENVTLIGPDSKLFARKQWPIQRVLQGPVSIFFSFWTSPFGFCF